MNHPNTDPKEPLKYYCIGCGEITEVKSKSFVELPVRAYQLARKCDDGKYRTCLCKKCLKDYKENEQWMKNLISSMDLIS